MQTAVESKELEVLRIQNKLTRIVLQRNLEGVTHEESLVQPEAAGNCINWVVGHLLWAYNNVLELLGSAPAVEPAHVKRYERGSEPVRSSLEATQISTLAQACDEACVRLDEALAKVNVESLDERVTGSPTGNPDETKRSLITTLLFHQTYHVGQIGILRRIAGKEGAIK